MVVEGLHGGVERVQQVICGEGSPSRVEVWEDEVDSGRGGAPWSRGPSAVVILAGGPIGPDLSGIYGVPVGGCVVGSRIRDWSAGADPDAWSVSCRREWSE